ncbi:PREDICTED: uncharacterized protein LOC105151936 [Acromyrmex echinatior]|uniref:uncharacterized protein LOC105151936 n=1 Tax=Acromyrmex echinatior TaxID=103372 RepID=UPI000580B488|nr:PREDICTED: uncharacterized protein LOC105151936 [Acromyrmex echinatior]
MIKLFLITLLCVAMFVDSQEDQMNEMGTELRKTRADMAEHAMMGQGSPLLMQRNRELSRHGLQGSPQGGPPNGGPPQGGPPRGGSSQNERQGGLTQGGGLQGGGREGQGEVGDWGQ